jgi:hypothetical protein
MKEMRKQVMTMEIKARQNKNKPFLDSKLDIQARKTLTKVFKHPQLIFNSQLKNTNNK